MLTPPPEINQIGKCIAIGFVSRLCKSNLGLWHEVWRGSLNVLFGAAINVWARVFLIRNMHLDVVHMPGQDIEYYLWVFQGLDMATTATRNHFNTLPSIDECQV